MRIVLDLPDWVNERHIYVMAGIELAAYKLYGEDKFHIKTSRCSQCGECCMNLTQSAGVPIGQDGHCLHLIAIGSKNECDLRLYRPFGCSTGMQRKGEFDHPSCTVEYKEQD